MSTTGISRRSLFTGIAAAALAPMLPRLGHGPTARGWDLGGPHRSGRWGVYDDSFLGQNWNGVRIVSYRGRYYRQLPGDIR